MILFDILPYLYVSLNTNKMKNKTQNTFEFKRHELNLRLAKQGKLKYNHFVAYVLILSYVNLIKFFNL